MIANNLPGFRAIFTLCSALIVAAACHNATGPRDSGSAVNPEKCPTGTAILTVPPIDPNKLGGWVPLGNLNPPSHVFPTDHQYLYLVSGSGPANLVSPGKALVVGARRTAYSTGGADYSIDLSPCAEVRAELGHVTTIVPSLLEKLGPFDQNCSTYSPDPATTVTACYTSTRAIPVAAGDALGTSAGLDFSLWDTRIPPLPFANASRWISNSSGFDSFHIVPASDYFAEPARSQIAAKVGSYDGRVRRTAIPLGGTNALDIAGSAQGAWFNGSLQTNPETPHLAIVPDNVDPTQFVFSVGSSLPGFPYGTYTFAPVSSGNVNRYPGQLAADGQIYCYELSLHNVILLQLLDAKTVRLEGRAGATSCSSQTISFKSASAVNYIR